MDGGGPGLRPRGADPKRHSRLQQALPRIVRRDRQRSRCTGAAGGGRLGLRKFAFRFAGFFAFGAFAALAFFALVAALGFVATLGFVAAFVPAFFVAAFFATGFVDFFAAMDPLG